MSEEHIIEALTEFATALDNAVCVLRQNLGVAGKRQHSWNPDAIKWSQEQGWKGPYEKAVVEGQPSDFTAMVEDLKQHKGCLNQDGLFYWLFEDGQSVGRKRREARKL